MAERASGLSRKEREWHPPGAKLRPELRIVTPLPKEEEVDSLAETVELAEPEVDENAVTIAGDYEDRRSTKVKTPSDRTLITPGIVERNIQEQLAEMRKQPDAPKPDNEWEREVEIQDNEDIVDYIRKIGEDRKQGETKNAQKIIDRETENLVSRIVLLLQPGKPTWGEYPKVGVHDRIALLGRPVGKGGMGEVQLGLDRETMEPVAVKGIRLDRKGQTEAQFQASKEHYRKLLKREIDVHSKAAESEFVIRPLDVVDLSAEEGDLGLVMPFVSGKNLTDFTMGMQNEEVEMDSETREMFVGEVMLELIAALQTLKKEGVMHRDIKPDNILLVDRPDGKVEIRLIDFGVSKPVKQEIPKSAGAPEKKVESEPQVTVPHTEQEAEAQKKAEEEAAMATTKAGPVEPLQLAPDETSLTAPDAFSGSPLWAAPEILAPNLFKRTDRTPTEKSELFSAGDTMYYLLTQSKPVSEADILPGMYGVSNVWKKIEPPSDLYQYLAGGKGHFDEITMGLLADNPDNRVGTYSEAAKLVAGALLKQFPEMEGRVMELAPKAIADKDYKIFKEGLIAEYEDWVAAHPVKALA